MLVRIEKFCILLIHMMPYNFRLIYSTYHFLFCFIFT